MMDFLNFTFDSAAHFWGVALLLAIASRATSDWFTVRVKIRPERKYEDDEEGTD